MPKRTCFLICPIGDQGSEIRKNSDDLLELVILPALERFNFEVIRADKIPKASVITTEIIQHVQNADLCIIDLTGSNANVFYECGRRHETGKPYIQLIRRGDDIPFDLSGIRTIDYDMSSPRTTRDTVKTIQEYVDELEKAGFQSVSSSVSLSYIADQLERIEKKLTAVPVQSTASGGLEDVDPQEKLKLQYRPFEYFLKALNRGDAVAARDALIRMYKMNLDPNDVLVAASRLAEVGDNDAFDILNSILTSSASQITLQTWTGFISFIRRAYIDKSLAKECHGLIYPSLQKFLTDETVANKDKGILLNEIAILQSAFGEYADSLKNAQKVIELDDSNLVYFYNLALVYQDMKNPDKALEQIDIYTTRDGAAELPPYILTYAIESYFMRQRKQDVKRVFNILKDADPEEARYALTKIGGPQAIL